MTNRYLVGVTTPGYVPKGKQYWNSLALIRSAQPVMVLLACDQQNDPDGRIEEALRTAIHWPLYRHMPMPASNSHSMIQHGRFLDAIPEAQPDDLIVLTDLDGKWQRDFYDCEWEWLESAMATDQLCAYWNCLNTDHLGLEAKRIELSEEWLQKHCPEPEGVPCYNGGFLAGRVSAFRTLQTHYEGLCEEFYRHAPHRSRCQFLINYCVHKWMGGFVTLPAPVHCHGHLRDLEGNVICMKGINLRGDVLCHEDVPVLFRHNF